MIDDGDTSALHRPDLERLLVDVQEIVPIARDWAGWMGFCPDALVSIAQDSAKEAVTAVESDGDTYENALGSTYLAGFIMGVLAEREVKRG